jgi:hypothetical protein
MIEQSTRRPRPGVLPGRASFFSGGGQACPRPAGRPRLLFCGSGLPRAYTFEVDHCRLAKFSEPLGQGTDGVTGAAFGEV